MLRISIKKKMIGEKSVYLLCFRRRWWSRRTEFDDMLFGLGGMLFDGMLLLCRCWIAFSLVPCALLVTITRDAPSKRSFKLSPTIRKFGKRIQHVFTVQLPLMPWHLHSWRISLWTCWNGRKRKQSINYKFDGNMRWNCEKKYVKSRSPTETQSHRAKNQIIHFFLCEYNHSFITSCGTKQRYQQH